MHYPQYSKIAQPIFDISKTKCGFEFEFYSHLEPEETQKSLEKKLQTEIQLIDEVHSDVTPTDTMFKLEKDYSGGKNLHELITGALPFIKAKVVLGKMFNWIKDNGYTTDRCGIHLNISFNDDYYGEGFILKLDKLKLILDFNEDIIYKYFPNRKENTYAKSIKFAYPVHPNFLLSKNNITIDQFMLPKEKYFGINFIKQEKNYLELRYLGGEKYESKLNGVVDIWEYFVKTLFNVSLEKEYTPNQIYKLETILKKHEYLINGVKNYQNFKEEFKDIKLTINLKEDSDMFSAYWGKFRTDLISVISLSGLTKGELNYDSDRGVWQIQNGTLKSFYTKGVELIKCKLNGIFLNCELYDCELTDGSLEFCECYGETTVKNSRVLETNVHKNCVFDNSYFKSGEFFGSMKNGSVFRDGKLSKFAKLDKDVKVVSKKKIEIEDEQ